MSNKITSEAHEALQEDNEENIKQFVTFHVGKECMAFDMGRVMEIVRVPDTVGVPMTPRSLLGLANLRGTILPVLCLRNVLGINQEEHTDATRVMVLNYNGQPMGFVVDRVTRVVNVNQDSIENVKSVSSTIDANLLAGVLKKVEGHDLVQLVNIDALTEREYGSFQAANQSSITATGAMAHDINGQSSSEDDDENNILQLVSFKVAGQEYSFTIEATQEIIRLPEKINEVPRAPSHVLGMIDLRNRVLPLVKLRSMFHLPDSQLSESNRIVVLTLRSGGEMNMVGVVVDEVREVLRIHKDKIEGVPALLLNESEKQDLEGICQLDNGKRIVTLLSAEQLFYRDEIIEAVESTKDMQPEQNPNAPENLDAENMNDELDDIYDEDEEPQLVVFNLEQQEYGVMIESVKEILRLPDNLTKVPKTLDFVEGMMNLRGNVLPIIDMRRRFMLPDQEGNDRQRILVLNHEGTQTGYIVDSVSEVLRLQESQIEQAPDLSSEQRTLMGRIVNLRDKKRIITVLEPKYLLSSSEQAELEGCADEVINR